MAYRKRIKITKGVNLNISGKGVGISVGVKGARIGIGPRGIKSTVSIPGTGFYKTTTHTSLGKGKSNNTKKPTISGSIKKVESIEKISPDKILSQQKVSRKLFNILGIITLILGLFTLVVGAGIFFIIFSIICFVFSNTLKNEINKSESHKI
jgi:hypothetical protein